MSPLQLAARYGRDPSADCGRQYDGCFLDLLQLLQATVDYFLRRPGSFSNAAVITASPAQLHGRRGALKGITAHDYTTRQGGCLGMRGT